MRRLFVLFALAFVALPVIAGAQCNETCCASCTQTSFNMHQGAQSGKWKSTEILHCEFALNWNCGPGGTPGQCVGPCPSPYDREIQLSYTEIDNELVVTGQCEWWNGVFIQELSDMVGCNHKPEPAPTPPTLWGKVKQLYRE